MEQDGRGARKSREVGPGSEPTESFTAEQITEIIKDGQILGAGAAGIVVKGRHLDADVAVKFFNTDTDISDLLAEVESLKFRPYEHIIGFRGSCTQIVRTDRVHITPEGESLPIQGMVIVMEYAHGGDLEHLLRDKVGNQFKHNVSLYQRMKLARDVARGMTWLHCAFNPPIIHRDLACKNVFIAKVGDSYMAKLGDLGSCALISQGSLKGPKGTPIIMAPELLQNKTYDHSADLYSFGLMLWEILTRESAFSDIADWETLVRRVCVEKRRDEIPSSAPPRIAALISRLWKHNPKKRLPAQANTSWVVDELENILVEIAIGDPCGRAFWAKHFLKREAVPWDEFLAKFCEHFGVALPSAPIDQSPVNRNYIESSSFEQMVEGVNHSSAPGQESHSGKLTSTELAIKCLSVLLVEKGTGMNSEHLVRLENFGAILNWIGPINDIKSKHNFLKRVCLLFQNKWFHGRIGPEQACNQIQDQPPGVFLVRFSSEPQCFTLVWKTNKLCKVQISRQPDGMYKVADKQFPSLIECIQALSRPLGLKEACPASPFAAVFRDQEWVDEDEKIPFT